MSTRWIVKAALAALLVFAAGCSTVQTTAPGAVGVDRKQQMLLSSEQIDQAAAQAYAQELAKARDKGVLNRNSQQVERVRQGRNRPLLHDVDPLTKLTELMTVRAPLYEGLADLTIATDGRKVHMVADAIHAAFKAAQQEKP